VMHMGALPEYYRSTTGVQPGQHGGEHESRRVSVADKGIGGKVLATNLPGQPGTTTYTDTNAASLTPRFYRVGVGN